MHCRLLVTYEGYWTPQPFTSVYYSILLEMLNIYISYIELLDEEINPKKIITVQYLHFLRLSFRYCISCVFNCGDLLCINFMALCLFVGI